MIKVGSKIKLNMPAINKLTKAAVASLEQTAEALHTEIVQAQVVPFDNGNLQNESMFVDTSESKDGKVSLIHNTAYARRNYFHPEYKFQKHENPHAKGKWFEDWELGGKNADFAEDMFKRLYRRNADL